MEQRKARGGRVMGRIKLDIRQNGYVTAQNLIDILDPVADAIADRMTRLEDRNDELRGEVKALRRERDTERRLRLSMRR